MAWRGGAATRTGWGRGEGQHPGKEKLASQRVSQAFGTTESQRDTGIGEHCPPPHTLFVCDLGAQRRARQGLEPSWPLTASSCRWSWVVSCHGPSGVTPTAAWLRPSSAWAHGGSSRLGRDWELFTSSRGGPDLLPHPCPGKGKGHLVSYLPSTRASVCTGTVKSCLELPWNTEAQHHPSRTVP